VRDALDRLREHTATVPSAPGLGSIGAMREAADELDVCNWPFDVENVDQ
jgi:hypothetical protein